MRVLAVGASMRPPLNAGENAASPWKLPSVYGASMRPPLNAGENADCPC